MSMSKALNNGEIDEGEFGILQELHLKVANELANVNHKMGDQDKNPVAKDLLEEISEIKKTLSIRDVS